MRVGESRLTACGPLCAPFVGERQSPCPSRRFRAAFGPDLQLCGGQNWVPGETQQSGFAGERRISGRSEFSPLWGGNEGAGACDDDKQDKGAASEVTLPPGTTAPHTCPQTGVSEANRLQCGRLLGRRCAGSYGRFPGGRKWGQKQRGAITSAVVFLEHLLPQQKNRGHAPERSLF